MDHEGVSPHLPTELLESGTTEPSRLRARWTALPRGARRVVTALVVVALVVAGVVWLHDRSVQRALEQRISLRTALGMSSSSTTPPGGEVGYFVVVRNEGLRRVSVTAVDGATGRLRLRMRDAADRRVDPGTETAIPLSVRLSCGAGAAETRLPLRIRVRREDGGSATRRVALEPGAILLDPVATLCRVRPDLRDHELSGPVLRLAEPGDRVPD
ncbi:MAG: hypothetical protein JWQ45_1055 [Blastococcus sp.]|nr:hypothetical protein [Blastococcus sp.]